MTDKLNLRVVTAAGRRRPGPALPIVHIGYHKTATTWFQQDVYPKARSHRYIPREVARHALLSPFGLSFAPEAAREALNRGDDGRPVAICEENLSGYIHNGGLHGLMAPEAARRIRETFGEAKIVMLIRSQPAAITASYVQYVRGGGTFGPNRYLFPAEHRLGARRHPYKAPSFAFEHFEYDRLIEHYDGLFGRENVVVRPYEAMLADPRAFLEDLSEETGLDLDLDSISLAPRNKSFGRVTLAVGRCLGLLTNRSVVDKSCIVDVPGFYELRRLVIARMAKWERSATPAEILGASNIDLITERYRSSNSCTMELRDLRLDRIGYPSRKPFSKFDRLSQQAAKYQNV